MSDNKNMVFDCEFPTWALNYLFNDDSTDLTPDEVAMVDSWKEHKGFFSCSDHPFFSWNPVFGLASTCVEVTYCYTSDFRTGDWKGHEHDR